MVFFSPKNDLYKSSFISRPEKNIKYWYINQKGSKNIYKNFKIKQNKNFANKKEPLLLYVRKKMHKCSLIFPDKNCRKK